MVRSFAFPQHFRASFQMRSTIRANPIAAGPYMAFSRPLQADGTAWMAFFCVVMLDMALELSMRDPSYEDMASKFFEHFIMIVDAMNAADDGKGGCWVAPQCKPSLASDVVVAPQLWMREPRGANICGQQTLKKSWIFWRGCVVIGAADPEVCFLVGAGCEWLGLNLFQNLMFLLRLVGRRRRFLLRHVALSWGGPAYEGEVDGGLDTPLRLSCPGQRKHQRTTWVQEKNAVVSQQQEGLEVTGEDFWRIRVVYFNETLMISIIFCSVNFVK